MIEKKLVPKRRFEGYTSLWEVQKLESLYQKVRNAFVGTATPYYVKRGNFYLQSNNVKNGQINRITEIFINDEFHKKQKDKLLHTGDLVMVQSGHVGHTAVITDEFDGIAAHALIMFQNAQEKVNSYFINFQFQTNNVKGKLNNITTGNTIRHILASDMADFELKVTDINEQKKIGNFFKHLDQMITLEQRKLEKTKALKSAYLAEMFPAEGERVPKRRFAGFKDEWQECKLGDLAEIVRGASPRPIQDPKWFDMNSNIGWLRISDVTEQNGRINYLKQRISILGQEKTRVLNEPHLLLSIAATVGKPVVNYVETGVHDGFLIFMKPKFDREFMFQWLEMFRPIWNKYGQPGSQVNLNSDIVKGQMVAIPSKDEQKMISKFFKKLDNQITNQQQKLEKLKEMKQAYLEEMFV